jgi:hypothetical protein
LKWHLSWHYIAIKRDTLQKGLPIPDETAHVLAENVEAPDFAIVKVYTAKGKGRIVEKIMKVPVAS